MGTATNATGLIPATEGYLLTTNKIWLDATPTTTVEAASNLTQYIVNENVIQTVATAGIQSGSIQYVAVWYPLTPDSLLVAA